MHEFNVIQLKKLLCKIEKPFNSPRECQGVNDWGDEFTYGLEVKTKTHPQTFGTYLGKIEDNFIIAVYSGVDYVYCGGESFDSIEEMKQRWELD